jgi:hypothetical protein
MLSVAADTGTAGGNARTFAGFPARTLFFTSSTSFGAFTSISWKFPDRLLLCLLHSLTWQRLAARLLPRVVAR